MIRAVTLTGAFMLGVLTGACTLLWLLRHSYLRALRILP